jgi:hypothetical protein
MYFNNFIKRRKKMKERKNINLVGASSVGSAGKSRRRKSAFKAMKKAANKAGRVGLRKQRRSGKG